MTTNLTIFSIHIPYHFTIFRCFLNQLLEQWHFIWLFFHIVIIILSVFLNWRLIKISRGYVVQYNLSLIFTIIKTPLFVLTLALYEIIYFPIITRITDILTIPLFTNILIQRPFRPLLTYLFLNLIKYTKLMRKTNLRLHYQQIHQILKIIVQILIQIQFYLPTLFNIMIQLINTPFNIWPCRLNLFQIIFHNILPIIYYPKRSINFRLYFFINLSQSFYLILKYLIY